MDTKSFLLRREMLVARMEDTRGRTATDWLSFGSTLFGAGLGLVMGGQRSSWLERLTQKLATRWVFRPILGFANRMGLSKYISTDLVSTLLDE